MTRRKRGLLGAKRSRPSLNEPSDLYQTEPTPEESATLVPSDDASPMDDEVEEAVEVEVAPATPEPIAAPEPEPTTLDGPPLEVRPQRTARPTLMPVDERTVLASLGPGEAIGQWIIDQRLGAHQGCLLFRAHHKDTDRIRVVLKVLSETEPGRESLIREGELLFALKHPNIASVRNLMLQYEPPFLEMDELPGDRLDEVLRSGPMFMAQALDLVEQLLGVLVYLHAREVYHRAIHPRNMLVRKDGVLTLLGFSYAIEDPGPDVMHPRSEFGYLPPEWPHVSDCAEADLYATGCLLFQMLTERVPFDAPVTGSDLTLATVLNRKSHTPFLDPGERFHEDLRAVVRMLTSTDSQGRLPTAATALGRLQRVERSYAL